MFKCEICGREFKSKNGLGKHVGIGEKKNITSEEYYLKYMKNVYGNPNNKCKTCGKETKYAGLFCGYSQYCSNRCINNSPEMKEKHKETSRKNWGCDHPMQNKEVFERSEQTNIKLYGYKNPFQVEEFKDKFKETNMKRRGCEWPTQNKEVRKKIKETSLKNWGVDNPMKNKKIKRRMMDTLHKNFGKYSNFYPRFSLESQDLFREIDKQIPKSIKCYFATNGSDLETNEYQVLVESREVDVRFLDFYIPSLKKCIEFDESFHKNQIEEDIKRENEIKRSILDIEILRISIDEYKESFNNTLSKCLEFLGIKLSMSL